MLWGEDGLKSDMWSLIVFLFLRLFSSYSFVLWLMV